VQQGMSPASVGTESEVTSDLSLDHCCCRNQTGRNQQGSTNFFSIVSTYCSMFSGPSARASLLNTNLEFRLCNCQPAARCMAF
jgi:hypothetical protein